MIDEHDICVPSIINHINYLIQVACLAQTKQWVSLLQYNSIHRREQQTHGFKWGESESRSDLNTYATGSGRGQKNQSICYEPGRGKFVDVGTAEYFAPGLNANSTTHVTFAVHVTIAHNIIYKKN